MIETIGGNYIIPEEQTTNISVTLTNDLHAQTYGDIMIPRPCSYKAEKLNNAVFYVDDDAQNYDIKRRNFQVDEQMLDRLTTNTTLVCRNG